MMYLIITFNANICQTVLNEPTILGTKSLNLMTSKLGENDISIITTQRDDTTVAHIQFILSITFKLFGMIFVIESTSGT